MSSRETSPLFIYLFGEARITDATDGEKPTRSDFEILYLLAASGTTHLTREDLISDLWPNSDDARATLRSRLRVRLSHLRQVFPNDPEFIPVESDDLGLPARLLKAIDLFAFMELLRKADQSHGTSEESLLLGEAVGLYSGPLLPHSKIKKIVEARHHYERSMKAARERLANIENGRARINSEAVANNCENDDLRAIRSGTAVRPKRQPNQTAMSITLSFGVLALLALIAVWTSNRPLAVARHNTSPADKVKEILYIRTVLSTNPTNPGYNLESRRAELCVELAGEASESWDMAGEKQWFGIVKQIEPDVVASVNWLAARDADRTLLLIGALSRYWDLTDQMARARRWMDPLMGKLPTSESPNRARALSLYAMCLLNAAEDPGHEATKAGLRAITEIQRAHDMYAALKDQWGQANTIRCRAHIYLALDWQKEAEESFLEALSQFNRLPISDRRAVGLANTYYGLGLVRRSDGPDGPNCYRQLRLFLTCAHSWKALGNEAHFGRLMQESGGRVACIYDLPNRHLTADRRQMLQEYIALAPDYLSIALLHSDRGELDLTHKALLRASVMVGDRKTFMEQIAFFIGRWSDLRASQKALLASFYVQHSLNETIPAVPVDAAKATMLEMLRSDRRPAVEVSVLQARSAQLSSSGVVNLVVRQSATIPATR